MVVLLAMELKDGIVVLFVFSGKELLLKPKN
jgi:hypothetical protein